MAELPDDILRFIDAARAVCTACAGVLIVQPSAAASLMQIQFPSTDAAAAFADAVSGLFAARKRLAHPEMLTEPVFTPEIADDYRELPGATFAVDSPALEAPPTKPIDVEVRQWAVERVERMPLYERMGLSTALSVADIFTQYAMTGAGIPQPEDPA